MSDERRYVPSGRGTVRKHGSYWQLIIFYVDRTTGKRTAITRKTKIACSPGSDEGRLEASRFLPAFRHEALMRIAGMNGMSVDDFDFPVHRGREPWADRVRETRDMDEAAGLAVAPPRDSDGPAERFDAVYEAPDWTRRHAHVVSSVPGSPVQIAYGVDDPWARLSLGAAIDRYIAARVELKAITLGTADDYHYSALHIQRSPIGGLAVGEVTSDDINEWMSDKVRSGTAPETLRKSVKIVDRLYRYLMTRSNNTVAVNPCAGALKIPHYEKPRNALRSNLVPVLNEQVSRMRDGKFKRAIVIALHTGMRIGEVCALRWCDVDMEQGLIHVAHAVAYARGTGSYIKDTKNHEARVIPIDRVGFMPWLEKVREHDGAQVRTFGAGKLDIEDCYIVSGPGNSFATTSYIRRAFSTFSEANDLMGTNGELITFHGLRHTFATQWIRHGGDIKSLQSILGHKDATVTLNVYADIDPLSKQHNMAIVAPGLWSGFSGVELNKSEADIQRIREAIEFLKAFGYRVVPPVKRSGRPQREEWKM